MSTATVDRLMASMRQSRGFPTMESTANNVLAALMGEKSRQPDVSGHIVEDFALTQKVLQLANSAMYAPFSDGSASVSSAMQVLGSDALLHLVLGTDLITQEELQEDANLARSHLAAEIAREALAGRAEDASVATYLSDLGRAMVGKYLPAEMADIEARMRSGASGEAAAQAVLGMTLEALGLEVARHWNLPTTLIRTMDGTGDPALVGLARFSNQASGLLQQGQSAAAQQLLGSMNLPGVDKSRLTQWVEHKASSVKTVAAPAHDRTVERLLRELHGKLSAESIESVDDLANTMFAAMAMAMGTSHSLLFMLTRSGEFSVRNGYGKNIDAIKGKLRISAEFKPTAFHAVVRNNVDVSISDVSKLKPSALPDGFRELFPKAAQFVILPVGAGRTTGLLYCGWEVHKPLSQDEMLALKQLRDLFVPFFPR